MLRNSIFITSSTFLQGYVVYNTIVAQVFNVYLVHSIFHPNHEIFTTITTVSKAIQANKCYVSIFATYIETLDFRLKTLDEVCRHQNNIPFNFV